MPLPVNHSAVIRHPHGWTFMLNGIYSPGCYRTRAIAAERLKHHKRARTAYYYNEENRRLTDKEQARFNHMMTTWTDADFLAALEPPPAVIRAKVVK